MTTHHLIIGYGYCGYYLAKELVARKKSVSVLSRQANHKHFPTLPIKSIEHDVSQPLPVDIADSILYYLIPPPNEGTGDETLRHFLMHLSVPPKKIIYYSSSGVYGNAHGETVTENSPITLTSSKQSRRLDAEKQWQSMGYTIPIQILRIAGIYGPGRIPLQAAINQHPLIAPEEAPLINHIDIHDLSHIAATLACQINESLCVNIANGQPESLGSLQRIIASHLNLPPAPTQSFEQNYDQASAQRRFFMNASKRLSIERLQGIMGSEFQFRSLSDSLSEYIKDCWPVEK